jgi:peptidoglycan/LPS O-acetylase OafA/YrhL
MLFYVATSVAVGWLVFEYFEKPVQTYLRSRYATYKAGRTAQPKPTVTVKTNPVTKKPELQP